jgi:DNA replication protein DnaC
MVDARSTTFRLDDISYLTQEKARLVDACTKCHGLDFKCECYHAYDVEVRKVRANIPLKYRKADLSVLKAKEAVKPVETLKAYIAKMRDNRNKGVGLYLWGSKGTAKTYSGCAVIIQALGKGYSAYYTTLDNCIDNLLRNKSNSANFANLLQTVSFLLIDDIGYTYRPAKDEVAYVDYLLDRIMRQRCNELLPTIATSRLSITDLEETNSSGSRISSIIKEHMRRVQFSGPDFRSRFNPGG